jgi:hypothetical protein
MTKVKDSIKVVIEGLMNNVMDRVLRTDPFIKEEHQLKKPLYAALVPDEIFKGSHFERRFVTPFGGVWEKLAIVVAQNHHGKASKGEEVSSNVGMERLRRIQEVLNKLEHKEKGKPKIKPNWSKELAYILDGAGNPIPTTVVCDILINSQNNNKKYAFELKAPLPNSDQTKVSKEKMFKLLAMEPKKVDHAFFALPYNPYGKKQDYDWAFPKRWFDMKTDESVLIGDEFWELIGGPGTYQFFIEQVNNLGKEYKERIFREFLGIEPPEDANDGRLK